jgi:hypothetical protein
MNAGGHTTPSAFGDGSLTWLKAGESRPINAKGPVNAWRAEDDFMAFLGVRASAFARGVRNRASPTSEANREKRGKFPQDQMAFFTPIFFPPFTISF